MSDISKRRESIVCSADGGEWRIVDRWDDKEARTFSTGRLVAGETRETPQDLPQEWTGSTRLRKSSRVLSDYDSENREHRETCSNKRSHLQRTASCRM